MTMPGVAGWVVTLDPTDGPNGTNLIPNPSFEYDTVATAPAGWAVTGNFDTTGATLTCQTGNAYAGINTMRIVSTATAHEGAECALSGTFNSGSPYTFQVALKGNAGGETLTLKLGTSADNATTATLTLTTSWQTFSVTWTPSGNRTGVTACIQLVPASIQTVFADAAIVQQVSSITSYFDADAEQAPASSYSWNGTVGNSTSTRTNTRTTLDINNPSTGIQIGGTSSGQGPDWSQSLITEYAAQESRYGSTVADYVWPNRTITIPLVLGNSAVDPNTALQSLREKVALFQREGGWLRRQRNGALNLYADVVDAQLTVPDAWGEGGHFEPGVTLTLIALPDFYGDEITLDRVAVTGVCTALVTQNGSQATIQGDNSARGRIIVTDTSGNNQLGMEWGLRSKHYDPATTAALVYEAEALTPINGAAVTGLSGASGGNVVTITSLPSGVWVSMLTTEIASGSAQMTHQGSYRVWARCYSGTGTPRFQFLWGVGSLSVPVTNTAVTLPGSGAFYLLDLGEVRLDPPPVGTDQWFGAVQVYATASGQSASIDSLYLQPLDEGAGQLTYVNEPPASAIGATDPPGSGADDSGNGGTAAWTNPGYVTGPLNPSQSAYAKNTTNGIVLSHRLNATSFGFALPSTATIQGIEAAVYRSWGLGVYGYVVDANIQLLKAGSLVGANRASGAYWPANTATLTTYGSAADLWGTTWAYSDINNSGFGLSIAASLGPTPGPAAVYANVFFVQLTVYFTLASGFAVAQDAVVYANQPCEVRYDQMVRGAPPPEAGVYGPVSQVVGDLARIPPSGVEGRPCQLFVKPSRGDLNALPDSGLDGMAVQVRYRPSFLFRP